MYIYIETRVAIRGKPIFKKNLISASGNPFLQFFQNLIQMKVVFSSTEIAFF